MHYFSTPWKRLFCISLFGTKYSRVDQVKFVEDSLSRPYPFNFFKGYLPQILLGPLLNTLSHLKLKLMTVGSLSYLAIVISD